MSAGGGDVGGREGVPSRRRRVAFRVVSVVVASGVALAALRWWGSEWRWSHDALEQSAARGPVHVPAPGESLIVHCEARGDYCAERYGAGLGFCWKAGCESPSSGFTTTPQGFVGPRGRVVGEGRAEPGVVRIVALGGSTTGGPPWEVGWPGVLEGLLGERAAREGAALRFEVLNLGLSGGGSADSEALFRAIGARFAPDVVILGEEVNDLGGCAPFGGDSGLGQGASVEAVVADVVSGARSLGELKRLSPWFARHADAFEAARGDAAQRARIARVRATLLGGTAIRPRSGDEVARECAGAASETPASAPSIFDDFNEGWEHTRRHYDAIRAEVVARGGRLVVTTVPHDFEDWRCPSPSCAPVLTLHDWRSYVTRVHNPGVRAWAAASGALLVDLEVDFDRLGAGPSGKTPLFAWEWMHPSPTGHRMIAERYADALWPLVAAPAR